MDKIKVKKYYPSLGELPTENRANVLFSVLSEFDEDKEYIEARRYNKHFSHLFYSNKHSYNLNEINFWMYEKDLIIKEK